MDPRILGMNLAANGNAKEANYGNIPRAGIGLERIILVHCLAGFVILRVLLSCMQSLSVFIFLFACLIY